MGVCLYARFGCVYVGCGVGVLLCYASWFCVCACLVRSCVGVAFVVSCGLFLCLLFALFVVMCASVVCGLRLCLFCLGVCV